MEQVILNFRANEQGLSGRTYRFASNTVRYVKAVFDLGDNWQGYDSVRAVWATDYNCISTVLSFEGECVVPFEVLKRVGKVRVNLVGSISTGNELTDRLTTYPLEAIIIDKAARVDGSETQPITPSQFEQFVAIVHADAEEAYGSSVLAKESELNAKASEEAAKTSEDNAKASELNAAESEANAKTSEDNAAISAASAYADAERAEQAAADAGFMFFHIDGNGHLIMEHTENVDNIDFSLVNGHLIMEVS